ncbi:SNF2 family N-terminal domain-containing protein [Mycena galericulata]|nr:SNF2 family N-terminal domain-containing protein [Mycena galericulata]
MPTTTAQKASGTWGIGPSANEQQYDHRMGSPSTPSSTGDAEVELLATVHCSVYLLTDIPTLQCGDPLKIFPDPGHYMSWFDSCTVVESSLSFRSDQPTPALSVEIQADAAQVDDDGKIGILSPYHASKLSPWLDKQYGVEIKAKVFSITPNIVDNTKSVILTLSMYAPNCVRPLYLPRMLWALADVDRKLIADQWRLPQEPPPLWQLSCLREHGLQMFVYADANWTLELSALDFYTGARAGPSLPDYNGSVPTELKTTLLPHQRQALQWALNQEAPQPPSKTTANAVQFWTRNNSNRFSNPLLKGSPPATSAEVLGRLARGGILADDMGLGKTLTILALIMITKSAPIEGFVNNNLIVAPLSVLTTWENEIKKHCPSLESTTYHPTGKRSQKGERVDFAKYDIVLCNYESLLKHGNPLSGINWKRVILDEAHQIRNPKTKTHEAVVKLNAHARWALTATPIINQLKDVGAIVHFLKICYPLCDLESWNRVMGTAKQPSKDAMPIFQTSQVSPQQLLRYISLRRTKEMQDQSGNRIVPLPKVTYQTIAIELGPEQQSLYNSIETSGKAHLRRILARTSQQGLAESMLTLILRLRQVVLHPSLVPSKYRVTWVDEEPQAASSLCIICFEGIGGDEVYVGDCHHFICSRCVESSEKCPCGSKLKTEKYTGTEAEEENGEDDRTQASSAKVEVLLALLKQTPIGDKSLVFSSFTRFLKAVEHRVKQEGIPCLLFHGQMTAQKRTDTIAEFIRMVEPRVMLVSLAAGAFGLNLAVANNGLSYSWWQPSIERQAVDRVNRIGQTKEVNVFRLVAKGTIEEKVLQIQAGKATLIKEALSETKRQATTSPQELQALSSGTNSEHSEKSRMLREALEL